MLAAAQYSVKLGDAGENLEIYNCFEGGEGDSGSFASLVVRLFADPVYLIESQNIVLRLWAQTTYRSNAPFNPFEGGEVATIEHTLDLAVPAAMLAHVEAAIAGDPDTQELLANATEDTLLTWLLDNASAEAAAFGGLRYTRRSDGIYLGLGTSIKWCSPQRTLLPSHPWQRAWASGVDRAIRPALATRPRRAVYRPLRIRGRATGREVLDRACPDV